jgi:hypothetical protein
MIKCYKICIRKYLKDIEKKQWNEFVSKVKMVFSSFDRNYLDYHQDRFIDHSVLILKRTK